MWFRLREALLLEKRTSGFSVGLRLGVLAASRRGGFLPSPALAGAAVEAAAGWASEMPAPAGGASLCFSARSLRLLFAGPKRTTQKTSRERVRVMNAGATRCMQPFRREAVSLIPLTR